jgi:hypothetical protein
MLSKRAWAFVFLGALLFGMISLVSAENVIEILGGGIGGGDISIKISDAVSQAAESTGFAKFLIFLLVTLIIYAILDYVPLFKSKTGGKMWLKLPIAIILGILSTLGLKNQEIVAILIGHEALGITFSAIIPFVLIAVLTTEMTKAGYNFFSRAIWLVFGVILLLKILTVDMDDIGMFGIAAYVLVGLGIFVMFLWEKAIVKTIVREMVDTGINKFRNRIREQDARLHAETETFGLPPPHG